MKGFIQFEEPLQRMWIIKSYKGASGLCAVSSLLDANSVTYFFTDFNTSALLLK